MCGPAALVVAGTVASMAGTAYSAMSANAQARYQARVAEANASAEREAARQTIQNTKDAQLAHYRKVAALRGAQEAGAAAAGVSMGFGTAGDLLAETDMLSREDSAKILKQGNNALRGHDIQISNYIGQGNAARAQGRDAVISSGIKMVGTALSGAQQYDKIKRGN